MEGAVCHGVSHVISHEVRATLGATHVTQNRQGQYLDRQRQGYHHQLRVGPQSCVMGTKRVKN